MKKPKLKLWKRLLNPIELRASKARNSLAEFRQLENSGWAASKKVKKMARREAPTPAAARAAVLPAVGPLVLAKKALGAGGSGGRVRRGGRAGWFLEKKKAPRLTLPRRPAGRLLGSGKKQAATKCAPAKFLTLSCFRSLKRHFALSLERHFAFTAF